MSRRFLMLLIVVMALTGTAQLTMAQEHGMAAPAGSPHQVTVNHEEARAPLVPSNGEELKEYSLQTAVWTLIIFVIMLIILYPTAWKKVLAGLKAREDRIRKDIAEAEAARAKAESTLKEYSAQLATAERKVQEMISKAVSEGEKLATSIKMSAQQEAEEAKERANRDIEAAKNSAIAEIHAKTVELATFAAEKILRRALNADDQRELVNRSLEQLQTMNKN